MNVELKKECECCGTTFTKPYACSINTWNNRKKYCSKTCLYNSQKGKSSWNKGIKAEPNDFTIVGNTIVMTIKARNGSYLKQVLVDKDVHDKIRHQVWTLAGKPDYNDYVWSNEYGYLHRFILGLPQKDKRVVDHINRNRFDCRLVNLRITTQLVNVRNHKILKTNTTGVNGVQYEVDRRKFKATIRFEGKQIILGRFVTLEAATSARKEAEMKYWKEPEVTP